MYLKFTVDYSKLSNIFIKFHSPEIEMEILEDKLSVQELEYRDSLIERGLQECYELVEQKRGYMRFLYRGNIVGFELCKEFIKLSECEGAIEELAQTEEFLFRMYLNFSDSFDRARAVEQYWSTRGTKIQVEFVFNRLVALKALQYKTNLN